jgi:4-amino-4-deoxy-L-arabinose transferase-like glycosyltransferase
MKQYGALLRFWPALWWAAIAALFALHFVHLRADFPNFSPWMDYAKYTDEGWYGNAAIRQALYGHWRLPGDFNPAVALPVWPLLLRLAFVIGGVSLPVARVLGLLIFGGNLAVSYALLRRSVSRVVALAGVSFLASSAYLWAFSRLAILEPLLILFLLLSWLVVLRLPTALPPRRRVLMGAGLLLALAVLTKTTAIFLLPSTLYLVWHANRFALKQTIRDTGWLATGGLGPWLAYYLFVVRPHLASDYHYLFAANRWDQPKTASGWFWAFWYALHGSLWVDPVLCGLAIALLVLSVLGKPRIWQQPLVIASLLSSAGYIFFTGWHNSPQPRYYEVVAYPLVFCACLGAASLWRAGIEHGWLALRGLAVAAWAVFAVTTGLNVRGSLHFARHPEYSFVRAARGITRYIDRHPNGNRLLLSISGDQIMLVTHLPAICDDFGTVDLPYRIHQYQPGWYAAWNEIDPGTLQDLRTQYSLEQVARFPALDDEDRDVLLLYKLHPLPAARQEYNAEEEAAANQRLE